LGQKAIKGVKMTSPRAPKAIGYTRVSSAEQAAEGVSLDQQAAKIKAYAQLHDLELVKVLRDAGYSAGDLDRPGMRDVLEMIRKREVNQLIVWRLDRMTRSVRDLSVLLDLLREHAVQLVSITEHINGDDAISRLLLTLLISVSQWEREATGERTKASIHFLRQSMRPYGRLAYGFRAEGQRLIVYPKEMSVVRKIFRWRHDVGLSYPEIARRLKAQKVATKTGDGSWHASTIRYIIRNKALYRSHVQEEATQNRVQPRKQAGRSVKGV